MKIEPIYILLVTVLVISLEIIWLFRKEEKRAQQMRTHLREQEETQRRQLEQMEQQTLMDRIINMPGVNRLTNPSKNKVLLNKIRKNELVTHVAVDEYNRIIITTKPLYVQVNGKERILGKYQIRVDFLSSYNRIQLLNISQRYSSYDGIHINNTKPCLGSISNEMYALWRSQNLEELLDTLLYFIVSPNKGEHAYISTWDAWFKNATPTPRGFNFAQYDRGIRQIAPPSLPLGLLEQQRAWAWQNTTRMANGGYII